MSGTANSSARFRRPIRHGPEHELVKEWHGEGGIAVGRAVDHALADEVVPERGGAADGDLEQVRNIA